MNCTEDQFRGILREEAADITPDSVPPLRLARREPTGPARNRTPVGRPGWRRLIIPLGAAASVTAIAVAATVFAGSGRVLQPDSAPSLWRGIPSYYLTLTGGTPQQPMQALAVRDTRSGATLTTASPSGCLPSLLSGAADDRTFAIACQLRHDGRLTNTDRLLLARFDPGTRRLSVTVMRLPLISSYSDIAISPDGTRIAVMSFTLPDPPSRESATLRVYSIATGAARTWTAANVFMLGDGVSWVRGSLLAFDFEITASGNVSHELPGSGIRLLNTNAPSGSLVGTSRLAVPTTHLPGGYLNLLSGQLAVSGNGATVATILYLQPRNPSAVEFAEFSLATGKLLRRWLPSTLGYRSVIWSDRTGKTLAVTTSLPGGPPEKIGLGVMMGDRFTLLRTPAAGAPGIAF